MIRSVKQRAEVPSITVVPLIHTQLERRGWRGVVGQLPEEQGLPEWRSEVAVVLGEIVRGERWVTRGDCSIDGDGAAPVLVVAFIRRVQM